MTFKEFVGEFLSFLERQEARLLSWGFYDFAYTLNDVEDLFEDFADDKLKEIWSEFQSTGKTMDELLDEMAYGGLLYPAAPEGCGGECLEVWVAPEPSVARTLMVWSPFFASQL